MNPRADAIADEFISAGSAWPPPPIEPVPESDTIPPAVAMLTNALRLVRISVGVEGTTRRELCADAIREEIEGAIRMLGGDQ